MSVRVRLTRVGSRKNPIWRVVVADQRSPRDGRVIESIGHYNPQTEPSTIMIDRERLEHWLERGAQPTNTVRKLMRSENTAPGAAATVVAESEAEAEAVAEPDAEADAVAEPEAEAETVAEPEAVADAEAGAEPAADAAEGPDEPSGEADAG